MKHLRGTVVCIVICLLALSARPGYAQNATTGSLTGVVKDAQGGVLPGATVTAVHDPTGTSYETVTEADGTFSVLNVRVGGPYTVTVALPGFKSLTQSGVVAKLGESTNIPVQLQLQTLTETVEVRADAASAIFTPSHAGTGTSIAPEAIQELPTISRSITDLVRTSPYVNPTSQGSDAGLQIAGRNNRYNNMQIDGAVNNDVFGLAATGHAGRTDRHAAGQPRRDPGDSGAGVAV